MTIENEIQVIKAETSNIDKVDFDNIKFGRVYSDHMFSADYINGEWGNLKVVPYGNISLSPANSAIHYGQSIFEGLKAYKGQNDDTLLFRADKNYKRLNHSAHRMCMPDLPEDVFFGGLYKLLELDKKWIPGTANGALYIRPFMFAMDEFIGIRPSDSYRFMIFTCPVGAYYAEPVRVKIEKDFVRSVKGGVGSAKTAGNYAAALLPAKIAQNKGYHQLIWTDGQSHEYIEESGTMNVMFVIDGKLITAPASETILDGVTRDSVLTLASEMGMEIEERKVKVQEIRDAVENGTLEEAFGTGTAATIANIALIGFDDKDFPLPELHDNLFSFRVMKEMEDIKRGRKADTHNWIRKVN